VQQTEPGPDIYLKEIRLTLGASRFHFEGLIRGGRITAVIGPSGSGKTTLLNTVAGYNQPDSGKLVFDGESMAAKHPAQRPVSMIFQEHNLFGHLDLFTNVGLGIHPALKLNKDARLAVSAALARVGLGGMERRKPATLSGGEKQRAAFARALVRNKPVLLMDEPFAALDPGLRLTMASLLRDLHHETTSTVLIVTHDPDEVRRLAQDVIFVENGRIAFHSEAADLLAQPHLPAIAQFLKG
jgi:thiamine transport system ATP-binding protein